VVGSQYGWTALYVAAKQGHANAIQTLISGGAPVNCLDKVCIHYYSQYYDVLESFNNVKYQSAL